MNDVEISGQDLCVVYVDMGTTNTRAWLCRGEEILAKTIIPVGVRVTAHDGSRHRIQEALRKSITDVRSSNASTPVCVAAAGMISSPLGLVELQHVSAPASPQEISGGSRWVEFPEITDLPMFVIPGVRCGPAIVNLDNLSEVDVMRGEETLCAGLTRLGLIELPGLVLNLGSHWKAVQLDGDGRIRSSVTSLSGELIHAAQTQTVLASSVSRHRPSRISKIWMEAGMKEQRRSALSRALFCVRLLDLANQGTPEDRLSFIVGAVIAADLDGLVARAILTPDTHVAISGNMALAEAWREALAGIGIKATVITADEAERAFLSGLNCILADSLQRQKSKLQNAPNSLIARS